VGATFRSTGVDRIFITDLLVRCVLGITDEERREKQDVLISLTLSVDLARAGRSDRIEDSVNYRPIKKRILALAERTSFHLVEALAERVAVECLEDPRILEVAVKVEKPSALRFARTVGVELVRRRG
jgi:FolB domain-containing protein